ncbi:unnamed protein product [Clavelina lepadiformis]|uniref:C2H2-type domain-containing protein n=1 Tax=Clavelina lepadiformis TaxID=159417 RepID=A0ABP0GUW8_CLALP
MEKIHQSVEEKCKTKSLEILVEFILEELKQMRQDMKHEVRQLDKTLRQVFPISSSLCSASGFQAGEINIDEVDYQDDDGADSNIFMDFNLRNRYSNQDQAGEIESHHGRTDESVHNWEQECELETSASAVKLEVEEDVDPLKWCFNDEEQSKTQYSLSTSQKFGLDEIKKRKPFGLKRHKTPAKLLHGSQPTSSKTRKQTYPCSECSKTFQQKCRLTRHMRTHTGIRPFKCVVCGKAFGRQDTLTRHKLVHLSKEDYSNPFFAKVYGSRMLLNEDMQTHGDATKVALNEDDDLGRSFVINICSTGHICHT